MGDLQPQREVHDEVGTHGGAEAPVLSANATCYAETTPEERLEAIEQLSAVLSATHAELLDVMAAANARGDWELDGAAAPAPWLVGRLGLSRKNADEWVRVAEALQVLPRLRDAYASGALSWDQVRPATKFVTPDDDADQAAELAGLSAAQIALMARQARPVSQDEALDAHDARSVSWTRDHRRGGFVLRGFVPFDQGDAIRTALDSIAESWGPDPTLGRWAPIATRRADALYDLTTRRLGSASAPDRATVVIHADAAVVDGDQPGNGFIGDLAICHTGVMSALCDARVEVALHGPDGATVGVARASQQVPWWVRRQVQHRDGTCRWPGCERAIRQIHHIHHWARGGPTNLDNLLGLCWHHHHLVHEGGWKLEGHPNHKITFRSPAGRRLSTHAQPLHPKLRAQLRHINGDRLRHDHPRPAEPAVAAASATPASTPPKVPPGAAPQRRRQRRRRADLAARATTTGTAPRPPNS